MRRRIVVWLLVGIALLASLMSGYVLRQNSKVSAAKESYERALAEYDARVTTIERVCEISYIWLSAELSHPLKSKVDAYEDHLDRLRTFDGQVRSLIPFTLFGDEGEEMQNQLSEMERQIREAEERLASIRKD